MKVALAGATGVIGRPLTARLVAAGHEVVGLTRAAGHAGELERRGARAVVCDVLDRERLTGVLREIGPEAVIHELTAIPKRLDPRHIASQLAPTNRLRTEGTRNLIEAAQACGARRLIAQSVAFAYGSAGPELHVEEDPLEADPPAASRGIVAAIRELEARTLDAAGLEGIVLRYGYFYGPGTAYASDGTMAEDVRQRRVPLVGDGGGVFSFVHADDAAAATVAALESGTPGIYNVVDDDPAAVREWLPEYARLLGAPPPPRVPRILARLRAGPYAVHLMCDQRGASNAKALKELGWTPGRPSWRQGFAAMVATV